MNTLAITLTDRDARFILEALKEMSDRWLKINQTTLDEDEQADYGNDYMVLEMTREKLEEEAIRAFGANITNFSREPLL